MHILEPNEENALLLKNENPIVWTGLARWYR